ncbi:DUF808 domain-containing protein [Vibrio rumoiensis]|uniref:DUF808 domain-containing protein n=1 Tax=Vibrio rumoiensis 1S-45 TaxID=1188252 RepID=A0A1E5E2J0_9VIBR|nr:DUF808 domain-containing protein [Vibrio rumoiensis]OEF25747.1 hypothetical protein A1QC_08245 [Vibrio rumoiensis 1S-45]
MAGLSLLTLLDDIASVLDDVALMSKVAAKKTAGVLGDDLALNAQQVSGVRAEREIPVVWSVAKGSFRNKLILVPSALLVSALAPWLIMPVLLIGGLYLCYEGAEKVLEKYLPHNGHEQNDAQLDADTKEKTPEDLLEYEQKKVKGAIRTDFILSLEIIVIALGIVQGHPQVTQIVVVSLIAFIMTCGVYGLVAGIVKLDDLGFYLQRKSEGKGILNVMGDGLVATAPRLMKLLTIVGTVAMFLVGGGIIEHTIPAVHHFTQGLLSPLEGQPILGTVVPYLLTGVLGLVAGTLLVGLFTTLSSVKQKLKH